MLFLFLYILCFCYYYYFDFCCCGLLPAERALPNWFNFNLSALFSGLLLLLLLLQLIVCIFTHRHFFVVVILFTYIYYIFVTKFISCCSCFCATFRPIVFISVFVKNSDLRHLLESQTYCRCCCCWSFSPPFATFPIYERTFRATIFQLFKHNFDCRRWQFCDGFLRNFLI